jgi:cytochrome c peroxidase
MPPVTRSVWTRFASIPLLMLVGLPAALTAQNTVFPGSNLQGDPSMLTPGGWVWPAAPIDDPFPNPSTPYLDDRVQLGKALFWDEQVSTSSMMACATCHIPEAAGIDPRRPGRTANAIGQPILGSFGVIPQSISGAGTLDYGFTAPPSNQETRLVTQIHVPTMIGAYMFREQFWDLRAGPVFLDSSSAILFPDWASLENQAVGPPTSDVEMGHQNLAWVTGIIEAKLNNSAPLALVVPGTVPASIPAAWLGMTYAALFDAVFAASTVPSINAPGQGVTRERFAMALASYMRTLVPDQAPIDTNTMTPRQLQGFDIFVSSGCAVCHSATGNPIMVNRTFPVIGTLANPWDNLFSDGEGHDIFFLDPTRSLNQPPLNFRPKTPTLRNIGLKSRFFHDGHGRIVAGNPLNTIPDIVDFYDIDQNPANGGPGGVFELKGFGGPNLTPSERNSVILFLRDALTDPRVAAGLPPFDHPTLFTTANPFNSNQTKAATPAGGGWTPKMIADVPPHVETVGGPNWWKIGVGSAGAGAGGPIIPPGSLAILFLGASDANPGPFYLTGFTPLVGLTTTAQGFATAQQPIVLTPGMIGTTSFLQWVVSDGTWVGHSESARFTVF